MCMCARVQIAAPCSDSIAKLVTVEQSCRVITGPLFRECNVEVSLHHDLQVTPRASSSAPTLFYVRALV